MTTLTRKKILEDLKDKETRELFASEHVTTGVPFQIHALREKLGLSQAELARRAGMAQERISILEDPNYEFIPKINTLMKLANVFDVPLIVKFGTWEELFDREINLSPEDLAPQNFDEALENLEQVVPDNTFTFFNPVLTTTHDTLLNLFVQGAKSPINVLSKISREDLIYFAGHGLSGIETEPISAPILSQNNIQDSTAGYSN